MQPIALIASDIDGTLLDEQGDLPEVNAQALRAAHARGVQIVLASIRKLDSSAHVAGLIGVPCTFITQGGARIYDAERRLLHESLLPLGLARAIADMADREGLSMLATIDEYNLYLPGSYPTIDMGQIAGQDVPSLEAALHTAPTRMIVRGQDGFEQIFAAFGDSGLRFVRHYQADGTLYDAVITNAAATKESGLAFVCQRFEIAPPLAMALGDAEADIGMIQLAGVGVAVANAQPAVLAAADWVAPAAHAGGVAAAVERFVLANPAEQGGG